MIWAVGGLLALGVLLWFARKAGQDAFRADVEAGNVKAAERINAAINNAPRSDADLDERLRDPARKL